MLGKYWTAGDDVGMVVITTGAYYKKQSRQIDDARYDVAYVCGHKGSISHAVLRRRKQGANPTGCCRECAAIKTHGKGSDKKKPGKLKMPTGLGWVPTPIGLQPNYREGDR